MLVKILVVLILNGILVESRNIISEKNLISDLVCNDEFWTLYQEYTKYEQNNQNAEEKDEELADFFVDISRVYRGWRSKIKDHSSKEFLSLSRSAQKSFTSVPPNERIYLSQFLHYLIGLTQNVMTDATSVLHNIIQPPKPVSNRPEEPSTLTPVGISTTEESATALTLVTTEKPAPESNESQESVDLIPQHSEEANEISSNGSIDLGSQPPGTLETPSQTADNIDETQNKPNENTASNAVDTVFNNLDTSTDVTTAIHEDSSTQYSENSISTEDIDEK